MPIPFMTRLIVPSVPPPSIEPLKVLAPPLGLRIRLAAAVLLLITLPPPPPSASDAIFSTFPFRSKVVRAAIKRAVPLGSDTA